MKRLLSFFVIILLCFSAPVANLIPFTIYTNLEPLKSNSLTLNQINDSLTSSTYSNFGGYIQDMLKDVTEATDCQFNEKDDLGSRLDTIKIIENSEGEFLGIYHNSTRINVSDYFEVWLANSTDLLNWHFVGTIEPNASQPTIAQAPNGAYIVALEKSGQDGKSHLQFRYYSDILTLLNNSPNATLDAPRSLSNTNEGTPNIYNITTEGSNIKACLGIHFLNNTISLDRVAMGWLIIPLNSPENMLWQNVTELHDYNKKLVSMGVQGNIGDRDYVQLLGRNYTLQEAQLRKDDWSSWRIFLYDHSKNDFSMFNIKTHKGSVSFSNPTCTILKSPNNKTCVLTTYFIHTNGSANEEAGQLIFYKEYLTVPIDYTKIQASINAAVSGDTIFVRNGTYYENVVVNKTLSLVGENKDTTIIDGDRTGNVVHVTSDNNNISGFTVQNSGPYPGSGFYIDHSSGNNISYNIIKNNNYGIWLYYSENNTVSSNNVLNNNVYGIYIHSSGDNMVVGNTASNNEIGIKVFHSDNNVLIDNKFSTNSYGIYCFSGNSNVVVGNTISSNSIHGISLSNSDGNTLSGGIASNNDIGMWLCNSRNNTICDNSIFSNNHDGIQLKHYSDKNTLTNNNVSNNDHGIYLENSVDNVIFHNNFINNTHQVFSTDSHNIWDDGYPSGGNYWSDYEEKYPNATEIDGSGIWDTPYAIDENNRDNYPIIPEFSTALILLLLFASTTLVAAILSRKSTKKQMVN